MKIAKVFIKGFRQFDNIELDLTNPVTGEPLDKFCFIGKNGTGKSSLLSLLNFFFLKKPVNLFSGAKKSVFALKLIEDDKIYYLVCLPIINIKLLLKVEKAIDSESP